MKIIRCPSQYASRVSRNAQAFRAVSVANVRLRSDQARAAVWVLYLVITICWGGSMANAANVPGFDKAVDFNVREQGVEEFLNALFQDINVPLSINSSLAGNVNGQFQDTASNVFNEISSAFSVVVYYDGAVAQAYQKNELSRRLLPVSTSEAKRVVQIVDRMKLPDDLNRIEIADAGLLATGVERFQTQIDEIITSVQSNPVKTPAKKKPKTVSISRTPAVIAESPIVYKVFKLKHAWAIDTNFPVAGDTIVVPGVSTILNQLLLEGGVEQKSTVKTDGNSLSGLKGKGLSSRKNANESTTALTTIGAADDKNADGPRIVADSRLNAIIIRDNENKMPAYQQLIDSLDTESGMVEIEATIIDINTDKTRDLGVNWRYQDNNVDTLFGAGSASDQALISGNGLITPQGQGGILSFALGEPANFLARVRLLEQKGAAKVVSKPHVITLSDVEAVLAATTEFFVRVAGDQEVDLFNVPVGTTLRVTPHIFTEGTQNRIKLLVNIEDGAQSANTPVDNIPVVERASISTQAVINEGDSLLVGGLVRDSYRNSRYQVPLLGRIPVIGGLFRSRSSQATRVERLFMITPRIASGIGFNGNSDYAALVGDQNRIVQDASRRIDNLKINDRQPVNYWSEQSRERAVEEPGNRVTGSGSQPATRFTPTNPVSTQPSITRTDSSFQMAPVAIIQGNVFQTPFTVEEWTVDN